MIISVVSDGGTVSVEENYFELNPDPITATAISPAEVSPISLQTIVITLKDSYPTTGMTVDDFYVRIEPITLEIS